MGEVFADDESIHHNQGCLFVLIFDYLCCSIYRVILYKGDRIKLDELSLEAACYKSHEYNFSYADQLGLPCYVAAELTPFHGSFSMEIGDGLEYNGFLNAPLEQGINYIVTVAAISTPKVQF